MTFRVTILGSSAALPTASKHHSAHVLNVHEQFYLVDCGEGTQQQLMRVGVSPMKISAVFITHLHGDHVFGLFPLLATMGMLGRGKPLRVFAPRPFDEILELHKRYFDLKLPFEVIYTEVDTRKSAKVYENKVMEVWSVPLRHRIPTSGFLFKEKQPELNVRKDVVERHGLDIAQIVSAKRGEDVAIEGGRILDNSELTYCPYEPRSYAYISDTLYSAKAAEIVRGVDLLYHEATFSNIDRALAKQTGHSTTLQAAKFANASQACRLIIGHFSQRYKDLDLLLAETRTEFTETELAEEGKCFEICVKRVL